MGLRDDDLKELEIILLENPRKGAVIEGLAGARKLRIKLEGRGKSGGGRVIYLDIIQKEKSIFCLPIQRMYRKIFLQNRRRY